MFHALDPRLLGVTSISTVVIVLHIWHPIGAGGCRIYVHSIILYFILWSIYIPYALIVEQFNTTSFVLAKARSLTFPSPCENPCSSSILTQTRPFTSRRKFVYDPLSAKVLPHHIGFLDIGRQKVIPGARRVTKKKAKRKLSGDHITT